MARGRHHARPASPDSTRRRSTPPSASPALPCNTPTPLVRALHGYCTDPYQPPTAIQSEKVLLRRWPPCRIAVLHHCPRWLRDGDHPNSHGTDRGGCRGSHAAGAMPPAHLPPLHLHSQPVYGVPQVRRWGGTQQRRAEYSCFVWCSRCGRLPAGSLAPSPSLQPCPPRLPAVAAKLGRSLAPPFATHACLGPRCWNQRTSSAQLALL